MTRSLTMLALVLMAASLSFLGVILRGFGPEGSGVERP